LEEPDTEGGGVMEAEVFEVDEVHFARVLDGGIDGEAGADSDADAYDLGNLWGLDQSPIIDVTLRKSDWLLCKIS
jgi:hypothetical protein